MNITYSLIFFVFFSLLFSIFFCSLSPKVTSILNFLLIPSLSFFKNNFIKYHENTCFMKVAIFICFVQCWITSASHSVCHAAGTQQLDAGE